MSNKRIKLLSEGEPVTRDWLNQLAGAGNKVFSRVYAQFSAHLQDPNKNIPRSMAGWTSTDSNNLIFETRSVVVDHLLDTTDPKDPWRTVGGDVTFVNTFAQAPIVVGCFGDHVNVAQNGQIRSSFTVYRIARDRFWFGGGVLGAKNIRVNYIAIGPSLA